MKIFKHLALALFLIFFATKCNDTGLSPADLTAIAEGQPYDGDLHLAVKFMEQFCGFASGSIRFDNQGVGFHYESALIFYFPHTT